MADLLIQGITVDEDEYPVPENIPVTKNISLTQLEEEKSWIS